MMPIKTLVVLLGPTGVGKTELSLKIAEFFSCPILNADSRQIYKDIPIGTASPTLKDIQRVPHYFVGTLSLDEYYSAAQYESDVLNVLDELFNEHDVCVLSGGSMMYIDAVCHGIDDIPTVDPLVREELKARYDTLGLTPLLSELKLLDPEYYSVCDLRNPKRVIHGLEVCYTTGKPFSSYRVSQKKERPFQIVKIGLNRDRADLFGRINSRVDQMVEDGLLDEARRVLPFRHCNSLNTVGYKELFNYFDGLWTLDYALEKIRRNSRVYAKKQLTWFKKDAGIEWFHPNEEEKLLSFLKTKLRS